jgi:hypothetical protein
MFETVPFEPFSSLSLHKDRDGVQTPSLLQCTSTASKIYSVIVYRAKLKEEESDTR